MLNLLLYIHRRAELNVFIDRVLSVYTHKDTHRQRKTIAEVLNQNMPSSYSEPCSRCVLTVTTLYSAYSNQNIADPECHPRIYLYSCCIQDVICYSTKSTYSVFFQNVSLQSIVFFNTNCHHLHC